ncbi:MAG: tol-pal system protein YbgF [Rhodospirillales bacterium]|jgi:tol-pal system protein YbgF|nr:tol-pal system protein YbgF [Rhodospirillales bacterium]
MTICSRWMLGIAAIGVAISLSVPPAFSQSSDLKQLTDRLQRLERDIRTLNVQISRGGGATASGAGGSAPAPGVQPDTSQSVARMELRLTALESELRSATGRAEEVTHLLDQMSQRLDKLIGDVDYRLGVIEKNQAAGIAPAQTGTPNVATVPAPPPVDRASNGAFASAPGVLGTISREDMEKIEKQSAAQAQASAQGQAPAQTGAEAPASAPAPARVSNAAAAVTPAPAQQAAAAPGVLPEGSPKDQYIYAFGLLRKAQYDDAELALGAFLETHADHELAPNARYWLGETFYVRGDYVKAAEIFLEGFQGNPNGQKAPDVLLKLGMSLANLDKKREACAAFGKLANEYTSAPANIKRLVARERSRNACE